MFQSVSVTKRKRDTIIGISTQECSRVSTYKRCYRSYFLILIFCLRRVYIQNVVKFKIYLHQLLQTFPIKDNTQILLTQTKPLCTSTKLFMLI